MKLERWFHEWDTFLLIMAFDTHPAACRQALAYTPGKAHLVWVCEHP